MTSQYEAQLIKLEGVKTYATRENAIKAVERKIAGRKFDKPQMYFIHTGEDGRFFPVFVGERAVQAMLHFSFNVVG